MGRGNKRKKGAMDIACITLIALLIAPLIVFGATQNATEQNITLPIPENVTLFKNLTEFNETQPQPENITDITAPIITILSPENTTYNTTAICLNYTIDEPTDWVGYSLNGASNVTIFMHNITFNAVVGLNNLIVYASDTAGNIGKAEVQFTGDINVTTENITKVTESSNLTPKLTLKLTKGKDCFALDEEPEFIFEFEYTGEEKAFGIAAAENETIETFVYDSSGKLTDIEPEIEKIRAGKFSIKLPKERAFRAGLYKLSVELVQDERVFVVEKEFPWGLVSLNTRKSIYKPGETAEFIIVVLDKDGHPVCDADISMTVTNPNDKKTTYSTGAGTILPGEECGLYNASYLTEVEGKHTVAVATTIGGVEVAFDTYFSVQQDYAFDIIRTAQSKIDPTRQDRFEVRIDIESFTDANSVTIKEFVPASFDVSTDATEVLLEDDTKTITWNKDLIKNKTSVSYSYSVPHVWPYLYALGPAELDYDSKSFTEARPWCVAVDTETTATLITPKLIAKKDFFALDEEPAFTFEYINVSVSEEELEAKDSGIAAHGEPQKALKKWVTENETIETFVYDGSGKLTDIEPEIEKIREGKFEIKLPEKRAFRAGLYKLSVELVQDEQVFVVEKEFPWGLVSLNTRKSIYKPGETAEFVIVVLDKDGHPVSGADISMTVTNPNNEKTVYRTDDGTILPGEECGLYNADYLTEVEGNHTIDIIALISGIEVNFSTHFLVKQDYAFDIIRTAQSKIDPTRQAKFDVRIDIESFTDADSVTIKEFVPAEFDVFSTDADTVLLEGDTKTITWTTNLTGGKTSVSYSYSVPHIWPYLYALGPAEINYDGKTFMEARPWYVAVDPSTITQYATRYTETPVLDTTTTQGVSALHYADFVDGENAVDTNNNLDKSGTWIVIADYDNETIPTGSSIDVVNVTFVWDTDDALTDEAGSWAKLYIGDNETGTPVWYLLEEWNNTNGAPSAYTTYYYTTLANGTPIKDIINTPAKASNMAMNFTACEDASGDQNVDVLLDQLIINVTYADTTPPTITIDTPTETAPVYRKSGEQFWVNFTYTEENPANYTVKIYNSTATINTTGVVVYPPGGTDQVANKTFYLNTSAADGWYNVSVEMYDNASNYNISYQNNSVVKDTTGPTVTIINPKNKTYNTVSLTLDSSASADAQSCWYSLNGGTNASFTCGEAVGITANEGSNNISVYANDTLENIGSDIVWFSVNTSIILDISITSPANSTITNDATPQLTLLAIDKDYPTIDYTLYIYYENGTLYSVGNSGTLNNNTPTQIVLSPAITLIGESTTYKIIAAANDSAPNYANSSDLYIIIQPPVVYLISPDYGYWDNDGNINFTFKYDSPTFPTANCSLYINSIYNQHNDSTVVNTETAFNVTGIAEGKNQNWTINCTMNGISVEDTSIFHVDKIVPTVTIDEPTTSSPVYRKGGEQFWVNFTYTELNPNIYMVEVGNSSDVINTTTVNYPAGGTDQVANVSFNLNSIAAEGWYNVSVDMDDNASNHNISYENESVVKMSWSNVTWISPPDESSYEVGETITLTCLVRDANTSASIGNYPVRFYNRTDSTVTHDFGVNYTNSSGYAVMDWDTTGVAAGWYYPMCNITDNATLFYNVSADNETNTSIKLYSPTLEIKNQTNVTAINFINFSGASGDTAKDPYNDVDGSGSPQNTSTTTPVVTIYNPSSSTNYKIWLKVTAGTGWSTIISNETFNVTVHSVSPGDVSTWATLTEWGSYKDSGVTVDHGKYKDLYLAFELKGSGTGSSTLSVLGEAV